MNAFCPFNYYYQVGCFIHYISLIIIFIIISLKPNICIFKLKYYLFDCSINCEQYLKIMMGHCRWINNNEYNMFLYQCRDRINRNSTQIDFDRSDRVFNMIVFASTMLGVVAVDVVRFYDYYHGIIITCIIQVIYWQAEGSFNTRKWDSLVKLSSMLSPARSLQNRKMRCTFFSQYKFQTEYSLTEHMRKTKSEQW